MQVACPSCSAEYPVDERRLPASGLKMRCPKCGARFHVQADGRVEAADAPAAPSVPKPPGIPRPGSIPKPGAPRIPKPPPAGAFGDAEDLDLPAPRGAKPPAPPAPPAFDGLDLPAPRGAKKAPIAPPMDDLDLPAPRGAVKAPPMEDLDLPAPRGAKKAPIAPPMDDLDLPAPRGAKKAPIAPPMDDLDLPAPRGAKKAPIAPPMDDLDLPAPRGAKKAPIAPPMDDLDLPAPRAANPATVSDFDLDLPAPKGPMAPPVPESLDLDLPAPRSALAEEGYTPFDDLDLPAAKSAADLPVLKGFDDLDLPTPKSKSVIQQADEAFGDLDLPMPKGQAQADDGFGDLDLPIPKAHADLPAPKSFGDLELPNPGSDEVDFGELDLPTPRDVTDLPRASEHTDLPAVSGAMDLPAPKGAGGLDDLALPEPRAHAPVPSGHELGGHQGVGAAYGELDLTDGVVPGGDDMEFADLPQGDGDGRDSLPPPRVAVGKTRKAPKADTGPKKSRAALIAGVLLVLLLGGGAALGLTPYGIFGINLLEPFLPGAGDPAQVQAAIRTAEERAASDRWQDIRAARVTLGNARREAGLNKEILARSLLHEGLYRVRFAPNATSRRASAIRARMMEREMAGPEVSLAFAADDLAGGDVVSARRSLGPALNSAATDPYVGLVAGELELATGNLEEAELAFAGATGAGARALWGVARVKLRGEDRAAARAAVDAVLAVSPEHGDALVASATLLREAGQEDEAIAIARRVGGAGEDGLRASPTARAEAWTLVGEVQERRGRQTLALAAYESALTAVDAHVPALLGAGRVLLADRPSDALPRFESVLHAQNAAQVLLPNGRNAQQEAQLGAARAMLALDRVQEAKTNLDALATELDEDGEVLLWLGKAELALDPPLQSAAEDHFRTAIQVAPQMFEAYLALAELFLETERGADTGLVLEQAVSRVPETAEMRYQLGQFELRRNRHAEAIRELRRALALDDSLPPALFALGVAQRRSGQLTQAAASFDRLAEIDNSYPGLSLERGLLFEARGESARAVAAYESALEAAPDDMDLLLRLGAAQVAAGQIDAAEETLDRVRNTRPNSAEANHFVGRVAFARGHYAEALDHFRRAIQLDPARGEFHLYVGWAALENDSLADALRAVDDAIERDPSLGDAYWIRGVVKLRSGRPADALEDLRHALELRPSRYEAYADLGEAYDQLRRTDAAIDAYQTAVSHIDDNGLWFYRLGRFQLDRGRADDAAHSLQRATLLGDASDPLPSWLAQAHRLRGEALQRSGHARDAIPHYRRYLELAADSDIDRRDVRQRLMDLGEVPP
ncbi:MAG: zinc-ribbon domain-containing protein [Sandaracinaceae bacterium]|nr:zinc-ribbon domain-containing protein [Sandaracinaceae bacterium]